MRYGITLQYCQVIRHRHQQRTEQEIHDHYRGLLQRCS